MSSKFPPRVWIWEPDTMHLPSGKRATAHPVSSYVDDIEYLSTTEHNAIVAVLEKKLAEARYETIKWCAGRILISGKQVAQLFNCNDDIFIELAAAFSEVADEEKKAALAKLKGEA